MKTMHLCKERLPKVLICDACGTWLKMESLELRGDDVTTELNF